MNGAHDLGGMQGFGPVERDEAEFHAEWEKRVRAMVNVARAQGIYNIDESRWGIERMAPADYLGSTYFERWLASLETNLVDKGLLAPGEVDGRTPHFVDDPAAAVPERADPGLAERVRQSTPHYMPVPEGPAPRFQPGDRVVTRNMHPRGHTRLPRYARGKRGVIHVYHGNHPLADAHAMGQGEVPEPLYSVRFDATELWGDSADGRGSVYIDLWESYLNGEREEAGA